MNFISNLENMIRSSYIQCLQVKYKGKTISKSINCDSYGIIVNEVKSVMIEGSRNGWNALETANNIIFKLLKANFFIYENHTMSVWIGYLYLKRQGLTVTYKAGSITNNSTLDDVRALTASW